jgi:hypothetical protein
VSRHAVLHCHCCGGEVICSLLLCLSWRRRVTVGVSHCPLSPCQPEYK